MNQLRKGQQRQASPCPKPEAGPRTTGVQVKTRCTTTTESRQAGQHDWHTRAAPQCQARKLVHCHHAAGKPLPEGRGPPVRTAGNGTQAG